MIPIGKLLSYLTNFWTHEFFVDLILIYKNVDYSYVGYFVLFLPLESEAWDDHNTINRKDEVCSVLV